MSRTHRLMAVLLMNLSLVAGLVFAGVTAHSLAVLAAGGDYLLDAAGVAVALVAANKGKRASATAALVNAGWLLVLELLVIAAAANRLAHGSVEVDGLPVLIVSAIAALVMAVGVFVLRGDDEDGERDLSVAAVLLDTVADAAAAAAVATTGAIILMTGSWYWLDPAVALVIAVVIAYHALVLLRKVFRRLRPAAVNQSE